MLVSPDSWNVVVPHQNAKIELEFELDRLRVFSMQLTCYSKRVGRRLSCCGAG